jgi:xanthine dehydrogenase accessory factor
MALVLIRGGGDLASGVALRLHRSRFKVLVSELAQPIAVRRLVSFAQAVYDGSIRVEGCLGRRIADLSDTSFAARIMAKAQIPVLIDPNGDAVRYYHPDVVVDARMRKQDAPRAACPVRLLLGLGPGFVAGINCDAVIETNRGISMGRVLWEGSAEPNTCLPEIVAGHGTERVLRAPCDGLVVAHAGIGERLEFGQIIAEVGGQPVTAPFKGVLRGLIHPGLEVRKDFKIGDVDPRLDPRLCAQVSDKALAVAGGVLEAILSSFRIDGRPLAYGPGRSRMHSRKEITWLQRNQSV